MHQSSYYKMKRFKEAFLKSKIGQPLTILDLGSYDENGTYKDIFLEQNWVYKGVDMVAGPNVDIVLKDPYHFAQIQSDSVDVLVSGQAFEHIEFFWVTMLEINRILKPGGLCCILAPSAGKEHRYPVDCWRFYPDGFSALARYARLKVLYRYTQWESDPQFDDDSNHWQDSVLICTKEKVAGKSGFMEKIKQKLLHKMLVNRLNSK